MGNPVPVWQADATPLEWIRLPANTHLLLYGTSHMQMLSGALRVAAKHVGVLKSTETISHTVPCHVTDELEPPDGRCEDGFTPELCQTAMKCGREAKPCSIPQLGSIARDHLEGGSTITTIGNHAQSQLNRASTEHWVGRLARDQGHNFTHAAFMEAHAPDYFHSQCVRAQTGEVPDAAKVGDAVEPCGDKEPADCPKADPRFDAVAQFVTGQVVTVTRPALDKGHYYHWPGGVAPRRETLRQAGTHVYLQQAYAPEFATPEMAVPNCHHADGWPPAQEPECGKHLCANSGRTL